MAFTFEGEITPVIRPREMMKLAELAEEAGLDRLGISDVVFYRDTYEIQVLCALVTKRMKIGSIVTNPYTRHPAVIASAAATLQEISDGRAFVGIGAGAGLKQLQVVRSPAAPTLREAVQIIRELLAGDTVKYQGKIYQLRNANARLEFPPQHTVPILIGTRSPRVAKLAGELADIIIIGARYVSEQQFTNYLDWIAQGAARVGKRAADLEIAPRLTICCSADGELARRSVKLYAAHYLALLKPPDLLADEMKMNKIIHAVKRVKGWYFSPNVQYPKEIDELVDEEIIDKFAIAGTPDECRTKIRNLTARFRFRSVSLNVAAVRRESIYEGLAETVKSLAVVIEGMKRK
ncbi:MAG: LLM class flavin-dependent oxidoreductase [Thermoproteota archaeon]|jgi:5,10-methylenetetrahydromethanopterin reductase|nr:LLM class flavin-dependent oxidoreductase [Thermoproteota archaeon]